MTMTSRQFNLLLLGAAGIILMASPASAQIGRGDAPVEITSKQAQYLQSEGRVVYSGDVVATQADGRITSDKLTMVCTKTRPAAGEDAACEAMEELIAEGSVLYSAPEVKIRGDRAVYDSPSDTITITGDVILSRGTEGVVRGTQVVYKVAEGRTIITAGSNRVTSIFTPASKRDPAAPATTTPRPN
jgi:lipopolysaccharide export system protein LptA